MKEALKKITAALRKLFGYGILLVLAAGVLTFFGYLAALIIGGDTAAAICQWIYKSFVPVMIETTTVLVLLGLVIMYLAGEKALVPAKKKTDAQELHKAG